MVVPGDTWGRGRKCSFPAEIHPGSGDREPIRKSGGAYDLQRAAVFHEREPVVLVERRVLAFLGHHLEEHVVRVLFLDALYEAAADVQSLILRIDEHPVHIGEHFTVVNHARETGELDRGPTR